MALGWLLKCPPLAQFRWDLCDALLGIAASVPMLLLFFACIRWPFGPLAKIKRVAEDFIRPLFAGATVLELALLSFAAGIGEEMLFRGLAQPLLARSIGIVGGVAVASLLFGLLHPLTAAYVLLAGAIGAYLGWLTIASGNLLCPILAHGFYDWVALIVLLRQRGGLMPRAEPAAAEESPAIPPPMP